MKKILVAGCTNCPYCTLWNDGQGNGPDSIIGASCNHPSFNGELIKPHFGAEILLEYGERLEWEDDGEGGMKNNPVKYVKGIIPTASPEWCPLPDFL